MSEGGPKGPYTVWVDGGYEGWSFTDHKTLKEAVESQKYGSSWLVMAPVSYKITQTIQEGKSDDQP